MKFSLHVQVLDAVHVPLVGCHKLFASWCFHYQYKEVDERVDDLDAEDLRPSAYSIFWW